MIELSVVIPTCHRPVLLGKALESLAGQTFDVVRFEVLVVDNGGDSETYDLFEAFSQRQLNLRYLREPSPGLHCGRHLGLRESRAEMLVFADDDIEAHPGWLEGVWKGFSKHGAVLVGGRNLPKWEVEPPQWLAALWQNQVEGARSLGYLSILDFGDEEKEIDPLYVWGCNFSIRRDILLEAGGFHPDSMPEQLLHLRGDGETYVSSYIASRGLRSVYIPAATVQHFVPKERMTIEYFRKRAFCQGISDSYTRLRRDPNAVRDPVVKSHPLRRLMKGSRLRGLLRRLIPSGVFLRANIDEAYWQGRSWHLERYLKDAVVREWVLRKSYLDLPEMAVTGR